MRTRHRSDGVAKQGVIFYWLEADMKTRQLIAAVIAFSAIAAVGSTFADSPSDGQVARSTKTRAEVRAELEQANAEGRYMNFGARVYIYDFARPEWIRPKMDARRVDGARHSGPTRDEARAELEQSRAENAWMNSGARVHIYDLARPEWIQSNRDAPAKR